MMRNNRLKQTKQIKQKKHKKQTKHKRRMQYGGKTYNCQDYSTILNTNSPKTNVVIPGYAEISDMIKEYTESTQMQIQLDAGIKSKNVVVYDSCERPKPDTPETSIILLKKGGFKSFVTSSIDCDDETYLNLASHNFQIFIKDILKWNPFLQNHHEKTEEPRSQFYGSFHKYNTEFFSYLFTQESWWNSQQWWNEYKVTLPTIASLVPTPTLQPSPLPTKPPQPAHDIDDKEANIRVLNIQVDGLNQQVSKLTKENQDLRTQIQQLRGGENIKK